MVQCVYLWYVCVRARVSMEVDLYLKWQTLRYIRTLGRNTFSVVFLKSFLRDGEGWKGRRMGKERSMVNNTEKTITEEVTWGDTTG